MMFMVSIGHILSIVLSIVCTHVALGHHKEHMEGIWYRVA